MTKLPPAGLARILTVQADFDAQGPAKASATYELLRGDDGQLLASLHQGPGPDGWWWATLLNGPFKVLGPADCRAELEAKVRRRCGRAAIGGAR